MTQFNITWEEQLQSLSKLDGLCHPHKLEDISVHWVFNPVDVSVFVTCATMSSHNTHYTFKPQSSPDDAMVREYVLSRIIAENLKYVDNLYLAAGAVICSDDEYISDGNVIGIHIADGVGGNKLILPVIEFMPGVHVDDISDELIESSSYQGIFKTDNLEEFEFLVDKKNAINVKELILAYTDYFANKLAFKDPAEPAVEMYQFIDRTEVYFSFEGCHSDVEEVLFTIKITRYNQPLNSTAMQVFLKNPLLPHIRTIVRQANPTQRPRGVLFNF
ncbi:hypothetical protein [Pseudomonas phage U1B]|nr:hypothetical protein [Pseudomonas phage T2P]QYV99208.1 hypothetical protein [Pseudomonas phage U1B]QYV99664.1 hypothetical protein [Pseudomonas phage U5]